MEALRRILKRWTIVVRSSLIGVFTGILPGAGGSIANILAYDQAKKASKHPEKFGTGIADGKAHANACDGAQLLEHAPDKGAFLS